MTAVPGLSWFNAPAWLPLVHALLHTLWQGAVVAGGLFLALRSIPARRANLRYGLSTAALALVLLLGLGSWALLDLSPRPRPVAGKGTPGYSPISVVRPVLGDSPALRPASTLVPVEGRGTGVRAATAVADPSGAAKPWVHWAAVFWLLGVSASLLRAARGAFGVGRLRRRCRDLADPRILALAEELRGRLRLSRRVRLLVSEEIGVPSVLGVFWPAVLLPASMITGVSPEQLRAILAHELVHILRWDYLVNLAQIFIEALIFFNPFVWWISRQMRLEREACCDQLAAAECQSAASYVEALVAVIEHTRHAAPATPVLAASGPGGHGGSALERAHRLLVPGYQPTLRLRWYSLLAVLILSASMLGGLWLGTRAVAQTIQAPEAKEKPVKPAATPSVPSPESFVATVSTADGAAADDDSTTAYFYESPDPNQGITIALGINQPGLIVNHQKGRFTIQPRADSRTAAYAVTMQGYAATFAGPFTPPFRELENIHFTLHKGLTASIETVDEVGKPIVGALLHGYYPGPPRVDFGEVKTNTAGVAELAHVGDAPLNVRVLADGFQGDELKNVRLDPAKPSRWPLKGTAALPGLVTAATTGQPVAGATIKLAGVRGAMDETNGEPEHAPLLATSDAQGRFALTSLRPDCRYYLFVEAPGYSGVFVRELEPSQGELRVSLSPERTVRGKLVHIPDSAFFLDGVPLFYEQNLTFDDNGVFSAQRVFWLHPKNGEADFSIGPFFVTQHGSRPEEMSGADGPVEMYLEGRRKVRFGSNDLPKADYTYDLAEEPGTSPVPAARSGPPRGPASSEPRQDDAAGRTPVSGEVLAAAREGDAKRALSLLEAAVKPKKFGVEDEARILDDLVRARELRAFTTLYDALWHDVTFKWKLSDEGLAGLVKDGRTDFLDVLIVRRFNLDRLTKAAATADPATAAWITRRVAEVTKQQADVAALCQAAADNDLLALQRLVDGGADVNGVGKDDNTPLIRAVCKDRLEAAQFLLDHSAQVDKPRLPGWNYTPLCLVNSVPMAELLKKHGADIHAKLYERDVSILTYVVDFAGADVVAWFLKQGLDANMFTDHRENLLFGLKDDATAEVLLAAGADPNQMGEFGHTPLADAQNAEVVRSLIRHGANLRPKLKDGKTLLENAVVNTRRTDDTPQEQAGYIEELIKQGAEFDPKGNGVRAMIAAAFHDQVGEVQAFLDHGVSPDASYERGADQYQSALSAAALQAPKSLKLLLERGADPNAPVPAGQRTPLDNALAWGAFGSVDLLRRAGAKGLSDLAYYSAKGDAAKVSELLDQHADPNEAGSSGWTPLVYAVKLAQVEVAKRLLDRGASVDQFDGFGFSAYLDFLDYQEMIERDPHQAQVQWHLPPPEAKARLAAFQQLFAQHPPNFNYRDSAGRTALHQAAWSGGFAVDMMLAGKPPRFDPNLPDKEGKTPLLLAALSPIAKDTREVITTGMNTPQQKTWNPQAFSTSELLEEGARLDLVLPGGKTVGELALAAARDANNAQLISVLSEARAAHVDTSGTKPGEPSASPNAVLERSDEKPALVSSSSLSTPTLPYKLAVTPESKKPFQGSDGIAIWQITGSTASFQTGGTYRITGACRQQTLKNATLYVGNTAEAGSAAIVPAAGSSLYKTLPNGSTEFDFTFELLRPGVLHLTIYNLDNHDKDDNAYAGIYLGKVASAEESLTGPPERAASPPPRPTPPPTSAGPLPAR